MKAYRFEQNFEWGISVQSLGYRYFNLSELKESETLFIQHYKFTRIFNKKR
jgi:hypothetical protein